MKNSLFIGVIIFVGFVFGIQSFTVAAVIENSKKPLDQTYKFPMEKLWSVDGGEKEDLFGLVVEITVTDSGNLFCRDMRNKKYYAFDKDGKFINHFGKAGEGPSEVLNTGGAGINSYKNTVMIQDTGKILYYNDSGVFQKTIRHIGSISLFLNNDEVIVAPSNIQNLPNDKALMKHVNLKTKKERVISDFKLFKGGAINQNGVNASVTIPTITPVMVIGENNGKVYYGMNDSYVIHISDLNGNNSGSFTMESVVSKVTLKEREDVLWKIARGLAPKPVVIRLAKTMPDKETHFNNIQFYNNMVYVYKSHFVPKNYQIIDIFTEAGKHLKRAKVEIEEGSSIISGPIFHKNFIYLGLMDEDDEIQLRKYKTALPE